METCCISGYDYYSCGHLALGTPSGPFGPLNKMNVSLAAECGQYEVFITDMTLDGLNDVVCIQDYGITVLTGFVPPAKFSVSTGTNAGGTYVSGRVADLDGDGIPDVAALNIKNVQGSITRSVGSWVGDGTGALGLAGSITVPTGTASNSPQKVAIDDVDNDGDVDVLVLWRGSAADTFRIALADGSGGYTGLITHVIGTGSEVIESGDIDEDGVPDVVLGRYAGVDIHYGTGTGGIASSQSVAAAGLVERILIAEVDGQPGADLVLGPTFQLLPSSAPGVFLPAVSPLPNTTATGFWFQDDDGDGRDDLLVTRPGELLRFPGLAGGGVAYPRQPVTLFTNATSLATADLNADQLPDLVVGHGTRNLITVSLGDGHGGLTLQTALPWSDVRGVAIVDLDGDGNRDLVGARAGSLDLGLAFGDGAGGFGAAAAIPLPQPPSDVDAGDLDGDGDPDLVAWMPVVGASRFLNDGNGGFGPAAAWLPVGLAHVLADLDGDGDLDVALTRVGAAFVDVVLGDGAGGLGAPTSLALGANAVATRVFADDVDRDGHVDLVTSNSELPAGGLGVSVFLGSPSGFGAAAVVSSSGPGELRRLHDVTGDGYPDLLGRDGEELLVIRADGVGGYGGPIERSVIEAPIEDLAVADWNGDHRPDVISVSPGSDRPVLQERAAGTAGQFSFGAGCAGSGGRTPRLTGVGLPVPGGTVTFRLDGGLPGATALLLVGVAAPLPPTTDCLHLAPPLLGPISVGSLSTTGALSLAVAIPVSPVFPTEAAVQLFAADAGEPRGFSATNGLWLRVE
ncbi:MAG: FG-GAP repeat domain-containing protein [Planctomycetota bacterium JB042]